MSVLPAPCNYCGQHPKNPPHDFCSKTCAKFGSNTGSQAFAPQKKSLFPSFTSRQTTPSGGGQPSSRSPICPQCKTKPRTGNFDFCGKTCRDEYQAQISNRGPNGRQNSLPQQVIVVQRQVTPAQSQGPPTFQNSPPPVNQQRWRNPPLSSLQNQSQPCVQCNKRPMAHGHPYCGKHCRDAATNSKSFQPPMGPTNNVVPRSQGQLPISPQPRFQGSNPVERLPQTSFQTINSPETVIPPPRTQPLRRTSVISPQFSMSEMPNYPTGQAQGYFEPSDDKSDLNETPADPRYSSNTSPGMTQELPCIMCKENPQRPSDYFCSSNCASAAMRK